jgi:hypothetical protein
MVPWVHLIFLMDSVSGLPGPSVLLDTEGAAAAFSYAFTASGLQPLSSCLTQVGPPVPIGAEPHLEAPGLSVKLHSVSLWLSLGAGFPHT